MQKGLLHLYAGDGKGKTTAAMGLALRALGSGKKVVIVQFLKGMPTAEIELLKQLGAEVLREDEIQKFVFQMNEQEKQHAAEKYTALALRAKEKQADVLILDEVCALCELGLVKEELLQSLILHRPETTEMVLTGRNPKDWMIQASDYYTEMKCRKHPYEKGIGARKGIEF